MKNFTITSKGGRDYNEDCSDSYILNNNNGIFVVADGLGGHNKGDVASKIACESIVESYKLNCDSSVGSLIQNAQDNIMTYQKENMENYGMMTTVAVLRITNSYAHFGHSGDSRIYHFRKNKLNYQTRDHSLVQRLIDIKEIKEEQRSTHPERNVVLKALGSEWDEPEYEVSEWPIEVEKDDVFLLCSDGFWDYVTLKDIVKVLKKKPTLATLGEKLDAKLTKAVESKNINNNDNYTFQIVVID